MAIIAIIVFLMIFTALALALPLSVEVSKKGWNNNILVDSSKDIARSQVAKIVLIVLAIVFVVSLVIQIAPLWFWLR